MSAETNIALIQGIYQAFGKGDVAAMLEHMADDIDWGIDAQATEVPWYGVGKGRPYAVKFFAALAKECVFSRFEPHAFLASDTAVACLVTVEATIKKTGRKMLQNGIHHFTIANGRVTKWRGWEDTARTQADWNG